MLVVTAAIICRQNEILIARRRPKDGDTANLWEFPGGKVEEGEHPEDGLRREIREELNCEIAVQDIYAVVFHRYPAKDVLLLAYLCAWQQGEPQPLAHQEVRWVKPAELNRYPFAPADEPIVQKLVQASSAGLAERFCTLKNSVKTSKANSWQ